jgi:ketosteroid isomerase-like protein
VLTNKLKISGVLDVLFLLCSCAAVVHLAFAATAQDEARKIIQTTYNKRNIATSRLDFEGYWRSHTDDFVYISKTGKRKGANQLKQESARLFNVAQSMSGHTTIENMTLAGNTAKVIIRDFGIIVIPVSATQKNVIKVTERASDTWVKRNGRWLQSQSKSLSSYMTVNGKPVKH